MNFIGIGWWLGKWSKADPKTEQCDPIYPKVLSGLIASFFILSLVRAFLISVNISYTNTAIHNTMAEKIAKAQILFVDSNPVGRILTRFSKDSSVIDSVFAFIYSFVSFGLFRGVTVAIMLVVINFWMGIPLAIAVFLCVKVISYGLNAMIEAQRYDGIVRGPIHQLFSTAVNGLVTIRAYDKTKFFDVQYRMENEKSANVMFTYFCSFRWVGMRLDLVVSFVLLSTTIMCITFRSTLDSELLALSLQQLCDVCVFFSVSIRFWAEMQNYMTSSQRMVKYTEIEGEDEIEKPRDHLLAENLDKGKWPYKGGIEFNNVTMRYRPSLEPSVRNLTFSV